MADMGDRGDRYGNVIFDMIINAHKHIGSELAKVLFWALLLVNALFVGHF